MNTNPTGRAPSLFSSASAEESDQVDTSADAQSTAMSELSFDFVRVGNDGSADGCLAQASGGVDDDQEVESEALLTSLTKQLSCRDSVSTSDDSSSKEGKASFPSLLERIATAVKQLPTEKVKAFKVTGEAPLGYILQMADVHIEPAVLTLVEQYFNFTGMRGLCEYACQAYLADELEKQLIKNMKTADANVRAMSSHSQVRQDILLEMLKQHWICYSAKLADIYIEKSSPTAELSTEKYVKSVREFLLRNLFPFINGAGGQSAITGRARVLIDASLVDKKQRKSFDPRGVLQMKKGQMVKDEHGNDQIEASKLKAAHTAVRGAVCEFYMNDILSSKAKEAELKSADGTFLATAENIRSEFEKLLMCEWSQIRCYIEREKMILKEAEVKITPEIKELEQQLEQLEIITKALNHQIEARQSSQVQSTAIARYENDLKTLKENIGKDGWIYPSLRLNFTNIVQRFERLKNEAILLMSTIGKNIDMIEGVRSTKARLAAQEPESMSSDERVKYDCACQALKAEEALLDARWSEISEAVAAIIPQKLDKCSTIDRQLNQCSSTLEEVRETLEPIMKITAYRQKALLETEQALVDEIKKVQTSKMP